MGIRHRIWWTLIGVILVAGCTPRPGADPRPAPESAVWPSCTNTNERYRVSIPPRWKVNSGSVLSPCSLFDPADVSVQHGTEIPFDIAISIVREPHPLHIIVDSYATVARVSEAAVSVGGHKTVRLEVYDPEAGAGTPRLSLHYLIEMNGETLVASTWDVGSTPYFEKKAVLDRMMKSLHFLSPLEPAERVNG